MNSPALRTVVSHMFGEVSVPETAIVTFVAPLWGFPDRHAYALLPALRQGLYWLQATDDPITTFVLADPFVIDANYAVDLSDGDRRALGIASESDVMALVMLTLPSGGDSEVTANFRAPIVFNLAAGRALQLVVSEEAQSLRRPVQLTQFPAGAGVALG